MSRERRVTRRGFLGTVAAATLASPLMISSKAFGANDRIVMGFVGMGGQGRGDMGGFLGFKEVQAVAVCDVFKPSREQAKSTVDGRYNNHDCVATAEFRDITTRPDIDAVFCATPDHWHALVTVDAMKHGKDIYCEKPETLTIGEGRLMVDTARRYGRVFSGGSQRVWEDYNWFHRMVRGGAIGQVREGWVSVGGPSGDCYLPAEPVPEGMDWDRWLGPSPYRPYNKGLHPFNWRGYRDYSGGQMTDWGAHGFGGALFCMGLQNTGPVEIHPPDGKDFKQLTYIFANGVRLYHGGAWGGNLMSYRGTEGECPARGTQWGQAQPPNIFIQNYRGRGGIFGDFLHCVKTRQRPFRDIEVAHRTVTVCHLGNIAYWLKRPLKWDPVKEEILGDPEAARWLDRPKREPWTL